MSELKAHHQAVAGPDHRLLRPVHDRVVTSYTVAALASTKHDDEIELSWDDFPDDAWPSDEWVAGCALPVSLWPEYYGLEGREHLA